ncbi:MAG: hypothetical protein CM15mP8_0420 [Methanobacteriota archaeon]|nr:MAG: hypothetical protein CM15mP8_0420 [Euryarchaeota archaeon]
MFMNLRAPGNGSYLEAGNNLQNYIKLGHDSTYWLEWHDPDDGGGTLTLLGP